MEQHLEQCYAIKFCVRLNKTTMETLGIFQEAFKEEAMSYAMIFMWHKRFKDGCGNVEDDDRSGRPSLMLNGTKCGESERTFKQWLSS
ncbi:hypothetical protein X975_25174, partial [Stegodyphus mimosarum]